MSGTFHAVIRSRNQESGRHVGSQHVTCDLLQDELIVRFVVVERRNHVIAIRIVRGRSGLVSNPSDSPNRTTSSQCRAQRSP